MWEACIEMATTTNVPLSFFSNSGFKKLIKPITNKFSMSKIINPSNVKNIIQETSQHIKNKIISETNKKIISLKIDAVSRHFRSLIGINIQYIDSSNRVTIKTLAVKEMFGRQTAANLKCFILGVLNDYKTSIDQIYIYNHN